MKNVMVKNIMEMATDKIWRDGRYLIEENEVKFLEIMEIHRTTWNAGHAQLTLMYRTDLIEDSEEYSELHDDLTELIETELKLIFGEWK